MSKNPDLARAITWRDRLYDAATIVAGTALFTTALAGLGSVAPLAGLVGAAAVFSTIQMIDLTTPGIASKNGPGKELSDTFCRLAKVKTAHYVETDLRGNMGASTSNFFSSQISVDSKLVKGMGLAERAFLIGHEVGHLAYGSAGKNLFLAQQVAGGIAVIAAAGLVLSGAAAPAALGKALLAMAGHWMVKRAYSRHVELACDRVAVALNGSASGMNKLMAIRGETTCQTEPVNGLRQHFKTGSLLYRTFGLLADRPGEPERIAAAKKFGNRLPPTLKDKALKRFRTMQQQTAQSAPS
jgi:hypothetical protein